MVASSSLEGTLRVAGLRCVPLHMRMGGGAKPFTSSQQACSTVDALVFSSFATSRTTAVLTQKHPIPRAITSLCFHCIC